jgi:hypothetical protein
MLSGILLFQSLCNVAVLPHTSQISLKLVSDSRKFVNKINKRLILSADHQVSFVGSHQELKKARSDLSHIEHLNIMADKLARSARKLKRKTKYTSIPQNPIDFTINDIAINSHYA